jgi:hypothetical protein
MTKAQRERRDHEQRIKQAQKRIGAIFQSRSTSPTRAPTEHMECQMPHVENDGSFQSLPVAGNSNPDTKPDEHVNFGGLV